MTKAGLTIAQVEGLQFAKSAHSVLADFLLTIG